MVTQQNQETARIEANAIRTQAHTSTYCLIDLTNGKCGTVVAVSIGSCYFLATAKHVIPASHKFKIVIHDAVDGVYDFAARHVHPTLDIGLLEVAPKDVPRFRDTFVPGNRIAIHVDQQVEYDVFVLGYPHKLIHQVAQLPLASNETLEAHQCNAFTFHSVAMPLSEWPSSGTTTVPVAGIDIFIEFNPEDSMQLLHAMATISPPTKIDSPAPHPAGISGGGIWRLDSIESNGVWQPAARLHGIQFGFNPAGWLRGALIDAWLDVVDNNYPDLKSDIQKIRQGPKTMSTT